MPTVCWVWPMHQISVAGFSVANIFATRSSCSPGTPLTRSTSSGIPFVDFLARLLETIDALLDEFLVFPAILEDVPHHPHQHRNVGAGPDADIFVGVRGGARHARIDDDEVRLVELLAFQQVLQRNRMRFRRIAAHDDHGLGVADVVEAVGHRAVAPGIGHAGDGGRMADARLVVAVVGAPERRKLAEDISAFVGEFRRAEPVDRIRPGFLADLHHLVADLVDGLVPFDAGPLAIDELHRIFQPAIAVHEFAHRSALGAMRAAVDRAFPARLLADPYAVRNFGGDGAADGTMRADALADRHRRAWRGWRTGLGLAHAGERQRAERRETAGGQTGAAQEAAAVETASDWLRRRRRECRAAPDVLFF